MARKRYSRGKIINSLREAEAYSAKIMPPWKT